MVITLASIILISETPLPGTLNSLTGILIAHLHRDPSPKPKGPARNPASFEP
jgi:hypothetical protein